MNIKAGALLISSPSLNDPVFIKAVIFITEYNDKGAVGFVINKLFPRTFNELTAFRSSKTFPLFTGGPMENENLFFIHRRSDIIEGGVPVHEVFFGGDFKEAVVHINNGAIHPDQIKIFVGYCGWHAGELEAEIEDGSWLLCDSTPEPVFSQHTDQLWEILYNGQV